MERVQHVNRIKGLLFSQGVSGYELEPEEVSAILRLKELGWGAKRISRELGISRNTAKDYIAAGGWTPYRQPQRKKALDGQEAWLRMPT